MIFLSLIAVLAIVYWSGATAKTLQHDGWFIWLLNRMRNLPAAASSPLLPMILALGLPLLFMVACIWVIVHFLSVNFLFFLYVPVLLYSLGRGDFLVDVNHYIDTANRGDSVAASKLIDDLCGHAANDVSLSPVNDWKDLHAQALKVINYRGFERTFAVLFWFVIAGAISASAVGALLYRLSVIHREQTIPNSKEALLAEKWLWLIEFPAVRLMGLTWAFVGNFDGRVLRDSVADTEHSSMEILNNSLRGALGAPTDLYAATAQNVSLISLQNTEKSAQNNAETEQEIEAKVEAEENTQEIIEDLVGISLSSNAEPAYSFALVKSSVPLYLRSLLFWVGAIAFATLFI